MQMEDGVDLMDSLHQMLKLGFQVIQNIICIDLILDKIQLML